MGKKTGEKPVQERYQACEGWGGVGEKGAGGGREQGSRKIKGESNQRPLIGTHFTMNSEQFISMQTNVPNGPWLIFATLCSSFIVKFRLWWRVGFGWYRT